MSEARWAHGQNIIEPQKFRVADLAVLGTAFVVDIMTAFRGLALQANFLAKAHANASRDSSEFAGSVEAGLDSLNTEETQT